MDLIKIKKELLNSSDDKKLDIILSLSKYTNKNSPITTYNFFRLYISFIMCHFQSDTKYLGLKLFKKILIENYFLFTEVEKNDINLLNIYYNSVFLNDKRAAKELRFINNFLNKDSKVEVNESYGKQMFVE